MDGLVEGVVLPLVVALATAVLAVVFALRQLRSETAFKRRLLWCEQAMKVLAEASGAIRAAQLVDAPYGERGRECWAIALKRYEELIPQCAQKEMYATVPAIQAINKFMRSYHDVLCGYIAHLSVDPARTQDAVGTAGCHDDLHAGCDTCMERLTEAYDELAGTARQHLGMDPLWPAHSSAGQRFCASFRGRDHDLLRRAP